MAYVRTVLTASGATAVQVVWSKKRGRVEMDHIGSAHTSGEVELLVQVAQQRIHENQDEHLTIVFAALAISTWIETTTGWTIKRLVRALRPYRSVTITTGHHHLTAEQPIPPELQTIITKIHDQAAH